MTPQETREAFMTEFQDLLRRYNAEFDIVEVERRYFSECVPEITFNKIYDEDGNVVRDFSEFQMPSFIS